MYDGASVKDERRDRWEGGHSEELGLSSVFVLMGLRRVWDGALGGKNVPDKGWELGRVH